MEEGRQTGLTGSASHQGTLCSMYLRPAYLPERNVAVSVGVGGKITPIRSKGYCCDWSLVPMDCLK